MSYEWDEAKARSNLKKHGIDFAEATSVLEDDFALTMRDARASEERWVTLGVDALGRTLVVVYSWRGERIRLISARPDDVARTPAV